MAQNHFYITLYDDDKHRFNIIGPTTTDSRINEITCSLQANGRKVRISCSKSEKDSNKLPKKEDVIENAKQNLSNYLFDDTLLW